MYVLAIETENSGWKAFSKWLFPNKWEALSVAKSLKVKYKVFHEKSETGSLLLAA